MKGLENCTRKVPPLSYDQEAGFDIFDSIPNNINIELYKPFINPYALYKLKDDIQNCPAFGIKDDLEHLMSIYDTRQVTTVFIRVSTLKFKSLDSLDIAQETMLIVQNHVSKYEGCIRQFHCDDKGALLLAFFGLPPFGHTDDAMRGVKAALSISKELADLFPEKNYSFGVTTGVIAIGGVGKSIRTEYAMVSIKYLKKKYLYNFLKKYIFFPLCYKYYLIKIFIFNYFNKYLYFFFFLPLSNY